MNDEKNYVVRATDDLGRHRYVVELMLVDGPRLGGDPAAAITMPLDRATAVWGMLQAFDFNQYEARICERHPNGTETPLPSYEETLEQLRRIVDATAGIGFTGPEDRALHRVDLLLVSRDSIARQRDEAQRDLTAIDHAVEEAGIVPRGSDDTLPDRVTRLIADANERASLAESLDDVLSRIVAAWRDDEVGQIDGALIEEAEALLGIDNASEKART